MQSIEDIILGLVSEGPIKGTELAAKVTAAYYSQDWSLNDNPFQEQYIKILESMVKNGLIIEVEYVLESMDYRTKSMYFPANTRITISGNLYEVMHERSEELERLRYNIDLKRQRGKLNFDKIKEMVESKTRRIGPDWGCFEPGRND